MRDRTHKCIQRVVLVVFVCLLLLVFCYQGEKFNFDVERENAKRAFCLFAEYRRTKRSPETEKTTCIFVFALNYTAYVPNINYTNQFY